MPIDPLSLSPTAWYKADAITGLADGASLGATGWIDSSGNGFTLTNSTSTKRPIYKTGILNGKPVVRFDGSDDALDNTSVSLAQPTTIFAVWIVRKSTGNQAIFDGITARQHAYRSSGAEWHMYAGTDLVVLGTNTVTQDKAFMSTDVFNGASSAWRLNDTANGAAPNPGTNALTGLRLGNNQPLNAAAQADIAEFLLFSGAMATSDQNDIRTYLGAKYGLLKSLPYDGSRRVPRNSLLRR